MRYQSTTTSPQLIVRQNILEVGKTYEISVNTSSYTSGSLKTDAFDNNDIISNSTGTITITGVANTVSFTITRNSTNVDTTIDWISIKEVITDNEGTRIDGWEKIDSSVLNLNWFGAKGDGITDDYAAIMLAHDALPYNGGTIRVPYGNYLHNTAIVFTKPVNLIGEGVVANKGISPSNFLKGYTINGDGVSFQGQGSAVKNIGFYGEEGNGGDGIVLKAGRIKLQDVAVFNMGNDGIRIGTNAGNENCNLWYLERIFTKENNRDGLRISEGSGGGADANGGTLNHIDTQSNGADGVHVGNAQLNTFTGIVAQTNGGDGLHVSTDANYNTFFGGDYEGNTSNDIEIITGATNNKIFGGVLGQGNKISDSGTETLIIGLSLSTYSGIPN